MHKLRNVSEMYWRKERKRLLSIYFNLPIILLLFISLADSHWIDLHTWYDQVTPVSNEGSPNDFPGSSSSSLYKNGNISSSSPKYRVIASEGKALSHGQGKFGKAHQSSSKNSNSNDEFEEGSHHHGGGKNSNGIVSNIVVSNNNNNASKKKKLPGCGDLVGLLSKAQIHICQLFYDHLSSLVLGAKLGLQECRHQFRYHQWNCSAMGLGQSSSTQTTTSKSSKSISPPSSQILSSASLINQSAINPQLLTSSSSSPSSSSISTSKPSNSNVPPVDWNSLVTRGSKEVAFAHAVWSAAVTQSIARSCRDGSLQSCGCGRTLRPSDLKSEWRWGGCGDNLQYGYKFSQNFIDSREQEKVVYEKKEKSKVLANLHNNEAGRRSVLKKTKIACKCHGVSGSCALVTCWHQVPSFREIGDHLKERYTRATLVKLNKRGRLQVKKAGDPVPSVYDLVYVESSPNYCQRNDSVGVYGTSGRICNKTASAPDSCKTLCCGGLYTRQLIWRKWKCGCKFKWCCVVECQQCQERVEIYACQ